MREYVRHVYRDLDNSRKRIKQGDGVNLFMRKLTAQILWLTLWYTIAIKLSPVESFLIKNVVVLVTAGTISFLWLIFKEKIPPSINDLITGNFLHGFSDIKTINQLIALFIFLNAIILFVPFKKIKNNLITP
jgi:hypothetical protein